MHGNENVGKMGKKLVGSKWRKRDSNHNGYLGFFWVNLMEKKNTMHMGIHACGKWKEMS